MNISSVLGAEAYEQWFSDSFHLVDGTGTQEG
jgi:hypothetical protein